VRRTVGELIDARDDAWPQVLEWTGRAARPVEIIAGPEAGIDVEVDRLPKSWGLPENDTITRWWRHRR
jgi:hypothetical protein